MVDLAGAPPLLPGDLDDDEITTPNEVAPKIIDHPDPEGGGILSTFGPAGPRACPYCEEKFDGAWSAARLGAHKKRLHPTEFAAEKAAPRTKAKKAPTAKKPPAPRTPRKPNTPTAARLSAADFLALAIQGFGAGALRLNLGPAAAWLSLMWEAPVAAKALDRAAAGTMVDKVLQPLARIENEGKGLASTVLLPLACGVIQARPALSPMMYPIARASAVEVLKEMVPVMRAQRAEQVKLREAMVELQESMAELAADAELPDGGDFIDGFLSQFFPKPAE